ncbi:hypothetical protein L6R52_10940 [Myxococcota bacterium]|nr:hypothetical protein [Myxococcota bacterium]
MHPKRSPTGTTPRSKASEESGSSRFKQVRVAILLVILFGVATTALRDERRFASWRMPVWIVVHPVVAEPHEEVRTYVKGLDSARFEPVVRFFDREAKRYGRVLDPSAVTITLGPEVHELPPAVPPDAGVLDAITWSLRFRWWAWRLESKHELPKADVRMFLVYHEAKPGRALEHSTALEKGRVGIVKLFGADRADGPNGVVLAHEILHTLGATDKYDELGRPIPPDGLADPARDPQYPQERAELMAGSIALSQNESKLPDGVDACVIGPKTAEEIGWLDSGR